MCRLSAVSNTSTHLTHVPFCHDFESKIFPTPNVRNTICILTVFFIVTVIVIISNVTSEITYDNVLSNVPCQCIEDHFIVLQMLSSEKLVMSRQMK